MYKLDNKLASHLAVKEGVIYFMRRVPSDLVGYYIVMYLMKLRL